MFLPMLNRRSWNESCWIIPSNGIKKSSELNVDLITNWRSDGSGLVGVLGVAGVTTRE